MMGSLTLIVGGGLAGLSLALRLERAGREYLLLEGRDRLGGRIKGLRHEDAVFDLGPSWFWPGQPRMHQLVRDLGLDPFEQHARGDQLFQDHDGSVRRGGGFASMAGSLRVDGGMSAVVSALVERLPAHRLRLNATVESVARDGEGVLCRLAASADGAGTQGEAIGVDRVVLAMPPRVVATLGFTPMLDVSQLRALSAIPTWMAGHAKFVAVYRRAFWRDRGLSGDAMSRLGPLAEIHDASALHGPAALFGFVGRPVRARVGRARALVEDARAQLVCLFGSNAENPIAEHLEDWSQSPFTATDRDAQPLTHHPSYGLPPALLGLWGGRLSLCSTEVGPEFGGYLEGALAAAERVADSLLEAEA